MKSRNTVHSIHNNSTRLSIKHMNIKTLVILTIMALSIFSVPSFGQDDSNEEALDTSIEALKKEVLSLNRDLFILEEDLLFPSNTQFSIFLSVNAGHLFNLDSVQLKIDNKNVANHLYTERELQALKRGGVQRLHIGNLPSGEHEIIAIFTGVGPGGRDYRRGKTIVIEKTSEPQFVEFTVEDNESKEQPTFDARTWE